MLKDNNERRCQQQMNVSDSFAEFQKSSILYHWLSHGRAVDMDIVRWKKRASGKRIVCQRHGVD